MFKKICKIIIKTAICALMLNSIIMLSDKDNGNNFDAVKTFVECLIYITQDEREGEM